jgi:hypothetical protein
MEASMTLRKENQSSKSYDPRIIASVAVVATLLQHGKRKPRDGRQKTPVVPPEINRHPWPSTCIPAEGQRGRCCVYYILDSLRTVTYCRAKEVRHVQILGLDVDGHHRGDIRQRSHFDAHFTGIGSSGKFRRANPGAENALG